MLSLNVFLKSYKFMVYVYFFNDVWQAWPKQWYKMMWLFYRYNTEGYVCHTLSRSVDS